MTEANELPHGMPACPHSLKVPCNDCARDARDAIEDCTCGARRMKQHNLGCPVREREEREGHYILGKSQMSIKERPFPPVLTRDKPPLVVMGMNGKETIYLCQAGHEFTGSICPFCSRVASTERPFHPARTLRPYTSAERKEMPVHSFMAYYFPDAIAAGARHSKKANDKHNPGEHVHWSRHKSTDHLECAARHLLTPDAIDADTGEIELVAAMWRCMAALQLREEKRLIAAGIMPLSGVIDA